MKFADYSNGKTTITIRLLDERVAREMYAISNADLTTVAAIVDKLGGYTSAYTYASRLTGTAAAEDAFDLTNNPSRQDEREEGYGRGRSVSTGDIIMVTSAHDKVSYVCLPIGWAKL